MAVSANSIITPQTPKSAFAIYATQQATYPPTTNPTNTQLIFTAGSNGARLTRLTFLPQETTGGSGVIQIFRSIDGGTTKYWTKAVTFSSDTVSSTDGPVELDAGFSDDVPMMLSGNEKVYFAPSVAKTFCAVAEYGDY
jgi:hypothetical protein